MKLPAITRSERAASQRCLRMWYWTWRRGLVAKAKKFDALDLGTWMHLALAEWYGAGHKRSGRLPALFHAYAQDAIIAAQHDGAPEHIIEKAYELLALGESMCQAYETKYGKDPMVEVIRAEIPLEFTISNDDGEIIAIHKLKPDLVFRTTGTRGGIWLMEHKTAKSIRTEHLVIDNQARPYGAMAEPALRKAGVLRQGENIKGIVYNFLRKGFSDQRPTNDKGQSLNKDGSVSKVQPAALFLRKRITMTTKAKLITLRRVQSDAVFLTELTKRLRAGTVKGENLPKTSHYSCPKMCPFFDMCVAEEEGTDIRDMERELYIRRDPYLHHEETTDIPAGFELG